MSPAGDRRTELLVTPDARQGPGPMPAAVIEALDPAIGRLVARLLPGARHATGVGLGTELAQLRPYEPGDDVRHIDPAASARTGTMHVRLHVPERAMTTWIVLDLTPSMAFGTARRLKADVAEGVALVFGRLGIRRAGNIGIIAFGVGAVEGEDGAEGGVRVIPPRGSKPAMVGLRGLLSAGLARDGRHAPDELAAALRRALKIATQPGLLVVISDFRDQQEWERPLGALRLRHAVLAIEVHDPRESQLPDIGRMAVVDPETGTLVRVDTGNRRLRERFAEREAARRDGVRRELRRLRIHQVSLSTDQDWLQALGRQIS